MAAALSIVIAVSSEGMEYFYRRGEGYRLGSVIDTKSKK